MTVLCYRDQRVLVLAPHADDETIGCGGVIQKYRDHGSEVRVVIASFVMGEYKRYHKDSGGYRNYSGDQRFNEVKQAMTQLGVSDYHILFMDQADHLIYQNQLDALPRLILIEKIEEHISNFRPTILFIPSKTKHQDHEALHEAAIAAARPYFWNGSIAVYETDGEHAFHPNLYISLTEQEMKTKIKTLEAYQTQLGSNLHPVSAQALLHKARFRGYTIYARYAEAFEIIRFHG